MDCREGPRGEGKVRIATVGTVVPLISTVKQR